MSRTIFWSWQSDLDGRVTRHLIREALIIALDRIHSSADLEERLELDHDTRGVPGLADIVASILEKIDAADVFVADITPIAVADNGKRVGNPNVLIELGYAKKALGPTRCVTVWNTAFTSPKPEDLPFDLRGRRAPISYSLAPGASRAELSAAREHLALELVTWISACIGEVPQPRAPAVPWLIHHESDPTTWFTPAKPFPINLRHGGGAQMIVPNRVQWYARMIPGKFDSAAHDRGVLGPIVGGFGGWSGGAVGPGAFLYPTPTTQHDPIEVSGGTLWVRDTGEVWSVESGLASEWQGRTTFNVGFAILIWLEFLDRVCEHSLQNGGLPPFRFKIGVRGLVGLAWPIQSLRGDHALALTDGIDREFTVQSTDRAEWLPHLLDAWAGLNRCFSLPAPSQAEIDDLLRRNG